MAKKDITNIDKRIKAKQKLRRKRNVKSGSGKLLLMISLYTNLYYVSMPYHNQILTNINEIYNKVAPIVENLINQLPL